MEIISFIYDDVDDIIANTYLIKDANNNCVVIDPSKNYDGIVNYIKKNNLSLKAICITHGHFDHIRGVDKLVNNFPVPVYIGFLDQENLYDSVKNLSSCMGNDEIKVKAKSIPVSENDIIGGLNEKIYVLDTPYHTAGAVCYYLKDSRILFSGDSLFKNSVGRDDLPGSIRSKRKESLDKIMALPDEVKVYPGHGPFTSIASERKLNPFVKN